MASADVIEAGFNVLVPTNDEVLANSINVFNDKKS